MDTRHTPNTADSARALAMLQGASLELASVVVRDITSLQAASLRCADSALYALRNRSLDTRESYMLSLH